MNISSVFCRTRIAPTPSGFLHLGNAFSFALTAELARGKGATLLLRIDDLDRERAEPRYVEDIFETLDFLGIPWDEGPRNYQEYEQQFSQVHRMGLYQDALRALREGGYVYACTCSRAQIARETIDGAYPGTCRDKGLPLDGPDTSWRLRTDMERPLTVRQLEGGMRTERLDTSMKDFVVRKKDGFPAYQLTSLVDDLHFGVDLIVRGIDLWASTLAQQYLAGLLPDGEAFVHACFYHHELLTDTDGGKLSKSAGATSIQFLRREGATAGDVYRMIGRSTPFWI